MNLSAAPLQPHHDLYEHFVQVLAENQCSVVDGSLSCREEPIPGADRQAPACRSHPSSAVTWIPIYVELMPSVDAVLGSRVAARR